MNLVAYMYMWPLLWIQFLSSVLLSLNKVSIFVLKWIWQSLHTCRLQLIYMLITANEIPKFWNIFNDWGNHINKWSRQISISWPNIWFNASLRKGDSKNLSCTQCCQPHRLTCVINALLSDILKDWAEPHDTLNLMIF